MSRSRLRFALTWLLVGAGVGLCLYRVVGEGLTLSEGDRLFVDWRTYANAVDRFQAGRSLFSSAQLAGPYELPDVLLNGYAYPPPSIFAMIPFASYPIGLIAWTSLNSWILITGLMSIIKRELGRCTPFALGLMLVTLACFLPFTEGVAAGNLNVGLAGVFAWSWSLGRNARTSGSLGAIGAILKLVPGVLVFWTERGSFLRTIAIAALVAGIVFVITLPLLGIRPWLDFVSAMQNTRPYCPAVTLHTSTACFLEPWVGMGLAKIAGILLSVGFGIGAFVTRNRVFAFCLLGAAWLAPVSDMHTHYLLIVYVMMVASVASVVGRRSQSIVGVIAPGIGLAQDRQGSG